MKPIVLIALPLAAAIISCLPWRRLAPGVTIIAGIGELLAALALAARVIARGPLAAASGAIVIDSFSALILVLIGFVAATAAIFSAGYLPARFRQPLRFQLYYANYNLFVLAMLLVPMLVEPALVWVAVGLTTVFSALLVCFSNTSEAIEAVWKYFVLTLMGAVVALLGFLLLFAAMQTAGGNTFTWDGLTSIAPRMPPVLLQAAFLLILIGLGAKVGLVPLHTWFPAAYSQAPSPVCALLSGVETTTVLYVILRLFPIVRAAPAAHAQIWAIIFGLVSVGTAVFLLLQVSDYKRLFAFSTIEHMGIILVAVGLGSSAASYGALYQAICHTVTKSFCFFAAGATLLAVDTGEIAAVRGLIRTAPIAGTALLLGGLAIAGAPPFAVFLSEFSIFKAGLSQHLYLPMCLLAIFVTIGFFGILQHINRMVFGEGNAQSGANRRLPASCMIALVTSGVLVIALGVYLPLPVHELLQSGAEILTR